MMLFFQSFSKGFIPPTLELANTFLKKILGDDAPEITQDVFDDWLLRQEVTTVSNDSGELAKRTGETIPD